MIYITYVNKEKTIKICEFFTKLFYLQDINVRLICYTIVKPNIKFTGFSSKKLEIQCRLTLRCLCSLQKHLGISVTNKNNQIFKREHKYLLI